MSNHNAMCLMGKVLLVSQGKNKETNLAAEGGRIRNNYIKSASKPA
jgi:hypothetical protein